MAVKIRLTRMGDKKAPFYRIVVADSRAPRDGRFIDILGTYDPRTKNAEDEVRFDVEKAKKWLDCGAQPTDTVRGMFMAKGLIEAKKMPAKTKAVKKEKEA